MTSFRNILISWCMFVAAGEMQPSAVYADGLRSSNQMPAAAMTDAVLLVSIANKDLKISYWNDAAWQEITVSSGQEITVPNKGSSVALAFQDGAGIQSLTLNRGVRYVLYWNAERSRWAIDPYDTVLRKPTGLRSH